jgi:hypothetical protein
MRPLARLLEPRVVAHAHCDLPCGVYDPAQARIEATKLAGGTGTKATAEPGVADQLLAKIEEISKIFWETKQG